MRRALALLLALVAGASNARGMSITGPDSTRSGDGAVREARALERGIVEARR